MHMSKTEEEGEAMEKLGAIASGLEVQPRASTAISKPTAGSWRPAEITQLDRMLVESMAYYPHQELGELTQQQYREEFRRMAEEHGLISLRVALLNVRRRLGRAAFFPHPSEIEEELMGIAKRRAATRQSTLPKFGCELCADGLAPGLRYVRAEDGSRAMYPCECMWRRRAAAKLANVQAAHDAKAKAAHLQSDCRRHAGHA
jgi:hypothetical protein